MICELYLNRLGFIYAYTYIVYTYYINYVIYTTHTYNNILRIHIIYSFIAYSLGTMFLKFINVDTCITTLCILTVPLCREKIILHLSISLLSLLFEVVLQ